MNKRISVTILFLCTLLISSFCVTAALFAFAGYVGLDGNSSTGAPVEAYINDVKDDAATAYVGDNNQNDPLKYVTAFEANVGDAVYFQIYGVNATQGIITLTQDDNLGRNLNLTADKSVGGAACRYSSGCDGGYCCSGTTEYTDGSGTGNCQASVCDTCTGNWTVQYGDCLANDSRLIYYIDQNSCGTAKGLPVDNGSYSICDYCTPNWVCNNHNKSGYCNSTLDLNNCYSVTTSNSDKYSGDYSEFPKASFSDSIMGNESSINSSESITVLIENKSISNWTSMTSSLDITFKQGNNILAEFTYNFSDNVLKLDNITVERLNGVGAVKGYIFVKGIQQEETKTLYLHNVSPNFNWVCIKDAEISDVSEITSNCKGTDEYHIQCNNQTSNGYECDDLGNNIYRITGLQHSGVIQADAPDSSSTNGVSGGGGNSGSTVNKCAESWSCTAWTGCSKAGTQKRRCTDENSCGTTNSKPEDEQSCNYIAPAVAEKEIPKKEETKEEIITPKQSASKEEQKPKGILGITGAAVGDALMSEAGIISARIILIFIVAGIFSTIILKKKNFNKKAKKKSMKKR